MTRYNAQVIRKISIILFILLVLFYFSPVKLPCKVPLPETVFACTGFFVLPLPMAMAALFSALGDWFGCDISGMFHLQVAFFSLAHLCMIWFFLSLGLERKRMANKKASKKHRKKLSKAEKWFGTEDQIQTKGKWGASYVAMTFIFAILLIYFTDNIVVSKVNNNVTSAFVLAYGCIITVMSWSALQQRDWAFAMAAILFVISDGLIAYSRFVMPVPHSEPLIMASYYAAQLLFFLRSSKLKPLDD